jgi:hypothetical protein
VSGVVKRRGLGEPDQCALAGDVTGQDEDRSDAGGRGDIDDGPTTSRNHRGNLAAHRQEGAAQDHCGGEAELVEGDVGQRLRARSVRGGCVDCDIQSAELADRPIDHPVCLSDLGNVSRHGDRHSPSGDDLVPNRSETLPTSDEHYRRPGRSERPRRGSTNAPSDASNQNNATGHWRGAVTIGLNCMPASRGLSNASTHT